MTKNCWNTDLLNADGEVQIGNGTNPPTSTTITGGTNCTVANGANSIQLTYSGNSVGDWVLVGSASASASSSIIFTDLSSSYFMYMLIADNYVPNTDGQPLYFQYSTNNGSSWDSTSNYSSKGLVMTPTPSIGSVSTGTTKGLFLTNSTYPAGNATNESCSGLMFIYNPSSVNYNFMNTFSGSIDNSGGFSLFSFGVSRENASAINAIKLFNDGSNITTCEVRLYGMVSS